MRFWEMSRFDGGVGTRLRFAWWLTLWLVLFLSAIGLFALAVAGVES